MKWQPKVRLDLGGGRARVIAHIGAFKVMEEDKVPTDIMSLSLSTHSRQNVEVLLEPEVKETDISSKTSS
jgi:hypothetical protein